MDKTKQVRRPANEKPRILLFFDTSNGYRRGLLKGIANYCNPNGLWDIRIEQPLPIAQVVELVHRWNAQGVISDMSFNLIADNPNNNFSRDPYLRGLEKLAMHGIPVIATLTPQQKSDKLYYIHPNNHIGGTLAADYYIEKGFCSYAFCGYKNLSWSRNRGDGYQQALCAKGFSVSIYEQERPEMLLFGKAQLDGIADWLSKLPQPVAVFACDDERARHVIEACKLISLRVPEEVAVLGMDNDELACALFNPPLSSISLNTERAGFEGAQLMDKLIAGQKPKPNTIIIQPQYVVSRQSTNILAIEDSDLADVLRFIREHVRKKLNVNEIVKFAAVSRHALYRKFHKALNRSPHEELLRVRVNEISQMLVTTNLSLFEIAHIMGEQDEKHIARYFRRIKGMTPSEYRKKYRSHFIT